MERSAMIKLKASSCHSESKMERIDVTAATGALGPVLVKLTDLQRDEKLQEGTRQGIASIKSRLEPVHDLLSKLWGREDLDAACKDWMADARELSYDLEDDIDRFLTLGSKSDDSGFINKHMERVKGVSSRCGEMQTIGEAIICSSSKLTTDPRALFLHKDASELVGMDEKKKEFDQLLKKHKMVCIVGFAGEGKTTLADLVYQKEGPGVSKEDEFQCRAFVSVHQNPNMIEILGTILSQVTNGATSAACGTEPGAEQNIINELSKFLSTKRYLVIIDDIWGWEEWTVIRKALPQINNVGERIIITTRINTIAEKCKTEEGAHVYAQSLLREDAEELSKNVLINSVGKKVFEDKYAETLSQNVLIKSVGKKVFEDEYAETLSQNELIKYLGDKVFKDSMQELPSKIVDKCGAMPLAVICLSSALAEWPVQADDYVQWDTPVRRTLDSLLTTPSLKPLVQSLCLSFNDLTVHQRTCLLYCSLYSPNYSIERKCLVRKWIAEGFVQEKQVAEVYFEKLVSRNLLQPVQGKIDTYRVHPMMLAFLVCKSKEDNFVTCWHYSGSPGSSSTHGNGKQIRRLSFYSMDRYPANENVSHTRSLVVVGPKQLHDGAFKEFRNMKVLEIDIDYLKNGHLVDICGLSWLRYLHLKGPTITELPPEIGGLQNLETLDISGTGVTELPQEIGKLQNLGTLDISGTEVTKLPGEIGRLENLETLVISDTKVTDLPQEIEGLTKLQTLNISGTEVTELPQEIGRLENLEALFISGTKVTELPREIEGLTKLETLGISGTKVMELPWEITKLQRLQNLDVSWTEMRELPKEIEKLQSLRTLDIRSTKVRELYWKASQLPNSLSMLVGDLDSHHVVKLPQGLSPDWENSIVSSSETKCKEEVSIVLCDRFGSRWEPVPVPRFKVPGTHLKVPQWVEQHLSEVSSLDIRLWKLGTEDDLKFLKTQMTNLQALSLRLEVLPEKPIAITEGGFKELEAFYIDCRLPRVITFQSQAMPKLKHLEFKFYNGQPSKDYSMGIKNLPQLEKVVFQCSENYTGDSPGISTMIEVVRKEAKEHPNKEITFYVNADKVLGSDATWQSVADKVRENQHLAAAKRSPYGEIYKLKPSTMFFPTRH